MRFSTYWRTTSPAAERPATGAPSLSLDDVLGLLDGATRRFSEIDLVLYGSTVHHGRLVGDVDLWLAGDPLCAATAMAALRVLENRVGIRCDVVEPPGSAEVRDLDAASQWCVASDGVVVAGSRPATPAGMTEARAEDAYRAAVVNHAKRLAYKADVASRAGLPSSGVLAEAALRACVRSIAADRHEQRGLRRTPTRDLLPRVQNIDPILFDLLRRHGWNSSIVIGRLADVVL